MGRDASKLGMVQRMILYCAQILYLKCIFGTKSRFGRSFPHMLANKMGLVSALNRALSKYSSAKEKQIMEIATIRS